MGHLSWLGGPTVLVELVGLHLLTDPMLGPRSERAFVLPKHPSTGIPDAAIARYTEGPRPLVRSPDAIIISHLHADHFDARARELLPEDVLVIAPPSAEAKLRAAGFGNLRLLDWGDTTSIETASGHLVVTAIPAHHAHDPVLDRELGKGNGYVLAAESSARQRYVIYWTGDAVLTDELRSVRTAAGPIDLLLPDLGAVGADGPLGRRTMNADEVIELQLTTRARAVVPIHHTTFSHYREPVAAFVQLARTHAMAGKIIVPQEGERIPLP